MDDFKFYRFISRDLWRTVITQLHLPQFVDDSNYRRSYPEWNGRMPSPPKKEIYIYIYLEDFLFLKISQRHPDMLDQFPLPEPRKLKMKVTIPDQC